MSSNTNENYQIFKEKPKFFVGLEVEGTKFMGQKTLFIRGDMTVDSIKEKLKETDNITHLFFGHSKTIVHIDNLLNVIFSFIDKYNITAECDLIHLQILANTISIRKNPNLCILLSVMVPEDMMSNIAVKIEPPVPFSTGKGVYVLDTSYAHFTEWEKYKKDEVV